MQAEKSVIFASSDEGIRRILEAQRKLLRADDDQRAGGTPNFIFDLACPSVPSKGEH